MIKAIFRDFDGTIGDTLSLVIQSINDLAKKHHRSFVLDTRTFRSQSMRAIIKSSGIHRRQVPFFLSKIRKDIQLHSSEIQTFPGVKEVLQQLSQKYIIGILTTNKTSTVQEHLEKNDFPPNIKVYGCGLWDKAKKIKKIRKEYNLKKDELLYIGDEVRDILPCKEAGVEIIAVSRGYDNEQLLLENKPDKLISQPGQILEAIQQLENKRE